MCLDNLHVQITFRKPAAGMGWGGRRTRGGVAKRKPVGRRSRAALGKLVGHSCSSLNCTFVTDNSGLGCESVVIALSVLSDATGNN